MAEMVLFNGQVDWWKSMPTMDMEFVDLFIDAIGKGTKLPKFNPKIKPSYRPLSCCIDIQRDVNILC